MKTKILIICILALSINLQAQNFVDALRFSQNQYMGTARFCSMGGSFGALGADLSVMATNPAGLAVYQKSELSITPIIGINKNEGKLSGSSKTDTKNTFNLANIGFVGTFKDDGDGNGWKNINFGFAMNRVADYNQSIVIEGDNAVGSYLDAIVSSANGKTPSEITDAFNNNNSYYREFMAWDTWAMDTVANTNGLKYTPAFNTAASKTQRRTHQITGGVNEFDISMSGNYNHILYLGATIGITSLKCDQTIKHRETILNASEDMNYFELNEYVKTQGTGFNFKFGAIVRPNEITRIGFAIHTPTFYSLNDRYSYEMTTDFKTADSKGFTSYTSPSNKKESEYDYSLSTPMRLIGSAGVIINKIAAINLEYEYVDYSTARFESDDYDYDTENSGIQDNLTAAHNFRIGGELLLGDMRLRAGYAYYGHPYKDHDIRLDEARHNISAGIGFVTGNIYMDLGYIYSISKSSYYMYDGYVDEPIPEVNNTNNSIVMSLGVKF